MNQQERDTLGLQLTKIATVYGHELTKPQTSAFINALIEYFPANLENYLSALQSYVTDKKHSKFPAPFQLAQYLGNELTAESAALEVAGRVRQAVSEFGWIAPEKARAYIGEVGWTFVQRYGGWQYLCENLGTEIPVATFFAQARDGAKGIIESAHKGVFNQPIQLPEPKNNLVQFRLEHYRK